MVGRILLVEDEDAVHFGVREFFAEMGWVVDCARGREEALERLATAPYAAVIADLRLSARDAFATFPEGLEVVEHVRRWHPSTRVVVLTACGSELEAEARRRGADCFMQKPQPLARVARVVATLCGRAGA